MNQDNEKRPGSCMSHFSPIGSIVNLDRRKYYMVVLIFVILPELECLPSNFGNNIHNCWVQVFYLNSFLDLGNTLKSGKWKKTQLVARSSCGLKRSNSLENFFLD